MKNVFELTRELAHYSNNVHFSISKIAAASHKTLENYQDLASDLFAISQKMIPGLSTGDAEELIRMINEVSRFYDASAAYFETQLDIMRANTDNAERYIKEYEKLAG